MSLFVIPRIVKAIELGDYAPELAGGRVYVWVNPPRDIRRRYPEILELLNDKANTESAGQQLMEWLSLIWSQGAPETHITTDDVAALVGLDTDPALYGWLVKRTLDALIEHAAGGKKK